MKTVIPESAIIFCCAFAGVLIVCAASTEDRGPVFEVQPENSFSKGKLYYRTLQLDEESNSIYVGAMNTLYRLWMFNINDTENRAFYAEKELKPTADALGQCAYRSRDSHFDCQNHVRVMIKISDKVLYVCSTNAFSPIVTKLDSNSLAVLEEGISGAAVCPVDPDDSGTAVWAATGNPGATGSIYSATVTDFTQSNRIIYRPPIKDASGRELYPFMRTLHTDSRWLNEPDFVGSFEIGQYVYFFFREIAVEYTNCGRAIYSRVARICKKDTGGRSILRQNWASFLKARLNCSLPGEFPFYFDQIQGVTEVRQPGGNLADTRFYTTMTTGQNGFVGSAVCVFRLRDIDRAFDVGLFKEQVSSTAAWLPVLPSQIPTPRPGQCADDTKAMSDSALHFVKSHLLMDDSVTAVGGRPLFYRRDLLLNRLVVDVVRAEAAADATPYHIIFAATAGGEVLKLAEIADGKEGLKSKHLATYRLPRREPITSMQLLKNEFLFVAQDSAVVQLSPAQCERYQSCASCTTDPYCSWNQPKQRCLRALDSNRFTTGWLFGDPSRGQNAGVCDERPKRRQRLVYPGDSLYLECRRDTADSASTSLNADTTRWLRNNRTVDLTETPSRFLATVDGGLVIVNVSSGDGGVYECVREGREFVASYAVTVDDVNCRKPDNVQAFQTVYKEWCREFQQYKTTMDAWRKWYEQNSHCANAPNFKKLPSSDMFHTNRIPEEKRR